MTTTAQAVATGQGRQGPGVPAGNGTGFCRVTVVAPDSRVDVALPEDIAVADLYPEILRLSGQNPAQGAPVGYHLVRRDGTVLDSGRTLAGQRILDGELLSLRPFSESLPPRSSTTSPTRSPPPSPRTAASGATASCAEPGSSPDRSCWSCSASCCGTRGPGTTCTDCRASSPRSSPYWPWRSPVCVRGCTTTGARPRPWGSARSRTPRSPVRGCCRSARGRASAGSSSCSPAPRCWWRRWSS